MILFVFLMLYRYYKIRAKINIFSLPGNLSPGNREINFPADGDGKKAPEGFLPEPFLPASPFLKGTYSRTFNFITLVLILPLVLPHGVIGPSARKRMDTAWYYLDYLIIKNVFLLPGDESPGKGLF